MDSSSKTSGEDALDRLVEDQLLQATNSEIWAAADTGRARRCECAACTILRPIPPPSSIRNTMYSGATQRIGSQQTRNPADSRARQPSWKCSARAQVGESGAGTWRTYGSIDLDHSAELRDHESGATSPARANKLRDAILSSGRRPGWVKKSGTYIQPMGSVPSWLAWPWTPPTGSL